MGGADLPSDEPTALQLGCRPLAPRPMGAGVRQTRQGVSRVYAIFGSRVMGFTNPDLCNLQISPLGTEIQHLAPVLLHSTIRKLGS